MKVRQRLFESATGLFRRSLSLRFLLVGCLNTAFSYCVFALLLYMRFSIELGSLLALAVGIFFSYCTQGNIVFRYASKSAFVRFVVTWVLIYLINLLLIHSLIALGANSYLAAAMATGPVVSISFFVQKLVVFRQPASLAGGKAS